MKALTIVPEPSFAGLSLNPFFFLSLRDLCHSYSIFFLKQNPNTCTVGNTSPCQLSTVPLDALEFQGQESNATAANVMAVLVLAEESSTSTERTSLWNCQKITWLGSPPCQGFTFWISQFYFLGMCGFKTLLRFDHTLPSAGTISPTLNPSSSKGSSWRLVALWTGSSKER